jgi:hypothetical protein
MAMQVGDIRSPNWLKLWWWRRLAHRREIELAVLDMRDRYGAAAAGIARNCARRGGTEQRRFWRRVARRLGHAPASLRRFWSRARLAESRR